MFKKTLMTAAAALAITAGATTIAAPDAKAGVSINLNFGGGGYYGGYYGGPYCGSRRVFVRYWHNRHHHMHRRWVWRSYC